MPRLFDILLTALAPAIWGSTYLVTTQWLPDGYPVTLALLRALPAGLLLLLFVRRLPAGAWWGRAFVLGALNFTVFWICLFVAAYRLPGGIAATVGAVQPLIVLGLARLALGTAIRPLAAIAAAGGLAGVALLLASPQAGFDPIGVLAALGGAASMATGTVLTRRWGPQVPLLTLTAWQLTAGGLLLLPLALAVEPPLPALEAGHIAGFAYLALIGAALTYLLWFRGIARLGPPAATMLGFLSPVSAIGLGWMVLGEQLDAIQFAGAGLVLASIWLGQSVTHTPATALSAKQEGMA
jgi:probable blue pigment (indigoidine) exporter